MDNHLTIVNPKFKYKKVALIPHSNSFYLQIAAEIDHSIFPFFLTTSPLKKYLIKEAKEWFGDLKKEEGVLSAVVFKAILIAPGTGKYLKESNRKAQVGRYDLAILIELSSIEKLREIMNSSRYLFLKQALEKKSQKLHIISATNVKRIGDVNHEHQGVFLFNYFFADDLQQNLEVWEYTAGWFQRETGLDNSTVLLPQDEESSKYKIINHCRWNNLLEILPSLLFKRSFQSYVLDNFYANK